MTLGLDPTSSLPLVRTRAGTDYSIKSRLTPTIVYSSQDQAFADPASDNKTPGKPPTTSDLEKSVIGRIIKANVGRHPRSGWKDPADVR